MKIFRQIDIVINLKKTLKISKKWILTGFWRLLQNKGQKWPHLLKEAEYWSFLEWFFLWWPMLKIRLQIHLKVQRLVQLLDVLNTNTVSNHLIWHRKMELYLSSNTVAVSYFTRFLYFCSKIFQNSKQKSLPQNWITTQKTIFNYNSYFVNKHNIPIVWSIIHGSWRVHYHTIHQNALKFWDMFDSKRHFMIYIAVWIISLHFHILSSCTN